MTRDRRPVDTEYSVYGKGDGSSVTRRNTDSQTTCVLLNLFTLTVSRTETPPVSKCERIIVGRHVGTTGQNERCPKLFRSPTHPGTYLLRCTLPPFSRVYRKSQTRSKPKTETVNRRHTGTRPIDWDIRGKGRDLYSDDY